MELDSNVHSVFLLHCHLVLAVKYRRKVFGETISSRAKEIFEHIAPNYSITLQEWNHGTDHVHILFRAHPNSEISKFINAYKSASSRLLKKEFPQIRQKLWKEYFWSHGFCLLTAGGAPAIKKYTGTQGEKERQKKRRSLWQTKHINSGFIRTADKKPCLPKRLAVYGSSIILLRRLNIATFCLPKSPSAALSSIAVALATAQSSALHMKICSVQSAAIFNRRSNNFGYDML